jgi:4-hydroxy-3-methylbut-2-enyl diphosphate reductase
MSLADTLTEVEILLAQPRGFCAGVDRAIEIVERAIKLFGAPIYVRHEIVHNAYVVEDLRKKGAIFIEDLADVPMGSTLIFSAHGVSKAVRAEAETRGLRVFDATCPLVTKVHMEVAKMRQEGFDIVMIGHKGHPEVEGTMGQTGEGMHLVEDIDDVMALALPDPERIAYVTQTTLSVDDASAIIDALKSKYPLVKEPKKQDICYATQNRQDAVKFLAPQCDVVIVVEFEPSARSGGKARHSRLYGGFADADRSEMGGGQEAHRRDGGRIGAGSARAGGDREIAGSGGAQRALAGRHRGDDFVSIAARIVLATVNQRRPSGRFSWSIISPSALYLSSCAGLQRKRCEQKHARSH